MQALMSLDYGLLEHRQNMHPCGGLCIQRRDQHLPSQSMQSRQNISSHRTWQVEGGLALRNTRTVPYLLPCIPTLLTLPQIQLLPLLTPLLSLSFDIIGSSLAVIMRSRRKRQRLASQPRGVFHKLRIDGRGTIRVWIHRAFLRVKTANISNGVWKRFRCR